MSKHKLNIEDIPNHPAISRIVEVVLLYGNRQSCVQVTCPDCLVTRFMSLADVKKRVKKGEIFTGRCRKCSFKSMRSMEYGKVPDHPSISKETIIKKIRGKETDCAKVTCPSCGKERWFPTVTLRNVIRRQKTYTGLCISCLRGRELSGRRADFDMTGIPDHPAIIKEPKLIRQNGIKKVCLKVVCVECRKETWWALVTLKTYKSNFHGMCITCWRKNMKREMRVKTNPEGRRLSSTGYILLTKNAISDNDLEMFWAMSGKGSFVSEHRWVMAKHLGRPLTSNELVDHRDGIHSNNSLDNLRIYIKGKNQEGSSNGYGTYYHEWQMAEKKIHDLEKKLEIIAFP